MPAAAVIPAPIAYIRVVAVEKLVVGFLPNKFDLRFASVSCPSSVSRRSSGAVLECVARFP